MSVRFGEEGDRLCLWQHGQTYSMVMEVPMDFGSVEEACAIMGQAPVWAEGLPLRADGYSCMSYRKE